jgi:Protein of unknown function (DUF3551)
MKIITFVLLIAGGLVMLSADPTEARGRAFCMRGRGIASRDCSFDTMAQCRASASGRGMHCMANPFFKRLAR